MPKRIPNCSSEDFGVPLGKCVMGIPVKLHFTFFLVFLVVLIVSIVSFKTSKYSWLIFLAYGPLLLLTVLLPEWGRAWYAIRKKNATVDKIVLWPLGGYVYTAIDIVDARDDILVALSGVLLYIPQIFFWFIIQASTGLSDFGKVSEDVQGLQDGDAKRFMAELSGEMIILNVTIFAMNLLVPAYPLALCRISTAFWVHIRGAQKLTVALYTGIAAMVMFIGVLGVAIVYKGTAIGIFLMTVGVRKYAEPNGLMTLNNCTPDQLTPVFGLHTSKFYIFMGGCQLTMQAKQGMHMRHALFARALYGGNPSDAAPEQARRGDIEAPPSPRRSQGTKQKKKSSDGDKEHVKQHKYDVDPEEGDWMNKKKSTKK